MSVVESPVIHAAFSPKSRGLHSYEAGVTNSLYCRLSVRHDYCKVTLMDRHCFRSESLGLASTDIKS